MQQTRDITTLTPEEVKHRKRGERLARLLWEYREQLLPVLLEILSGPFPRVVTEDENPFGV